MPFAAIVAQEKLDVAADRALAEINKSYTNFLLWLPWSLLIIGWFQLRDRSQNHQIKEINMAKKDTTKKFKKSMIFLKYQKVNLLNLLVQQK